MVHDPRVSTLLSRLGGLYRDPARVDRDASSLLKSSVGAHLTPGIAPLVENNGDSSRCMVLQGTIAIVFRGNTYQLLVDAYLPPGYPIRPPVSYVRLAPNMYLKENHPHVGSDGMVYMPYTHEWNPRTHSLIEMIVAMSSVFSAEPPVFTRSGGTTAAAAAPAPAPAPAKTSFFKRSSTNASSSSNKRNDPPPPYVHQSTSQTPSMTPYVSPPTKAATMTNGRGNSRPVTSNGLNTSVDSDPYVRSQMEQIMLQEAKDASAKEEQKRREMQDEKQRKVDAEKYEVQKTKVAKDDVNRKVYKHLKQLLETTRVGAQSDWREKQLLKESKQAITAQTQQLETTSTELKQHITSVDRKTSDIREWLNDTEKQVASQKEVTVDDMCRPVSKVHAQLLDLSAENAALSDALYFLDRGINTGNLDCATHLKSVRKLAKQQFLIRAHVIKINEAISRQADC